MQSSWHREVVEECRIAFLEEIEARGIARAQVDLFEVPGSFEIPLHAQLLAKTRRYTAIVAAGLVVDGGIYRHEFVADTVIKALMDVQLRTEVPVFSAVLTPQQFHESAGAFRFLPQAFCHQGRRGRGSLRQHAAQPGTAARPGRGGDRVGGEPKAMLRPIVISAATPIHSAAGGGTPVDDGRPRRSCSKDTIPISSRSRW